MFVILYHFFSSRSPNPLKIYQKVFIELATKYSKRVLNQSHSTKYSKHQKRSLSNTLKKKSLSNTNNWGKRSDTMNKEVEQLMPQQQLDNEIFSKRIWLEEKKPEQNSDVPEIQKVDVTSSRLSPIRRSDINRILRSDINRILYTQGSLLDLFPLPGFFHKVEWIRNKLHLLYIYMDAIIAIASV